MKFSAVLTKKQAEEMLVYLGDLFTEDQTFRYRSS